MHFLPKKIEKTAIKAYPNPTNHLIQILPSAGIVSKTEIYDISGRMVMKSLGDNHLFDVSKLKSGIYFVRITTISGQIGTTQFTKQ